MSSKFQVGIIFLETLNPKHGFQDQIFIIIINYFKLENTLIREVKNDVRIQLKYTMSQAPKKSEMTRNDCK